MHRVRYHDEVIELWGVVDNHCLRTRGGKLFHSFPFSKSGRLRSQEIEPTEQELRVELERFRRGSGESDFAASTSSSSAIAPDKKESEENTSALMVAYDPSMRSDSTRGMSSLEAQELPNTYVEPVRGLPCSSCFFFMVLAF